MESQSHIDLVKVAINYIRTIVPSDNFDFIQIDSAGSNNPIKFVGNFVPDIYYSYDSMLIIGEAKTINDFDRPHSKEQYEAYIIECDMHDGKAILVISVPWQFVITAKNYFKRIKVCKRTSFEVVIINELGRCFKI